MIMSPEVFYFIQIISQSMKIILLGSLILFSGFLFGQSRQFEIFGTITGKYNSKIYLFFDNHYRQRDSISSEIKNGKFYFKGNIIMPVLGRLHLDQESLIADFYIDNDSIYVHCINTINISVNKKKEKDTLNQLVLSDVKGSPTQDLINGFETWLNKLKKSGKPEKEKNKDYYEKLLRFVEDHPKSKASLFLLARATSLDYVQAMQINSLIDTSLNHTYETNSVEELLTRLNNKPEKMANRAMGAAFHDVILPDTSGNAMETKQFRGKYTLIEFWASWCGPCREANPSLKILYDKFKRRNFEIVGISADEDKGYWKKAIIEDKLNWPQLLEGAHGKLSSLYDIRSIPSNILLDKEGKIAGLDLSIKEIEKRIKK